MAKIGIEDFAKVELRVGLVKTAEKVAGTDKLLKLTLDVGDGFCMRKGGFVKFHVKPFLKGAQELHAVE